MVLVQRNFNIYTSTAYIHHAMSNFGGIFRKKSLLDTYIVCTVAVIPRSGAIFSLFTPSVSNFCKLQLIWF